MTIAKNASLFATLLLLLMFALMLASVWNDSAIFDEVAHIGAGYAYLKYQDGRLNPEHPPLLKSLAAMPLLFLNLKENITAQPFWTIENVNDRQWAAGNYLLYESGNDADQILFWSRLPMIILTILFGLTLFLWVKKRYGSAVGLVTLFFFAVSPTFLAHGRYVTTDVGAAFGFFLGIVFFLRFLEKQDLRSAIWLGVVLGTALLLKFSLVLLFPIYLIILAFRKLEIGNLLVAALIALSLIYAAYVPQIWNYPRAQQIADARHILAGYQYPSLVKFDFWLTENRLTRPLALYLQGFLMVARRTVSGNTAYFMGEVSSKGWWSYFPVLALTKEQLGFYVLAFAAIIWGRRTSAWTSDVQVQTAAIFIIFYWLSSILNPLNIGVRHVLPTFPFLYFLVAKGMFAKTQTKFRSVSDLNLVWVTTLGLMLWMVAEMIFAFPHYLSYYNIFGGGLRDGHKIATDSNYDWGQDLKRLKTWKEKNGVEKIYLDYFGGGSPRYYFGEQYEGWWSARGAPPASAYFAVSLNALAGAQAKAIGDVKIKPEDSYSWLKNKTPIARGGSSILIYRF